MDKEEHQKFTTTKFKLTIKWMVDIASTFYPMTDNEKESLENMLSKLFGEFINGCEDQEKDE